MFLDITGFKSFGKTSLAVWWACKHSYDHQRRITGNVEFVDLPNTVGLTVQGIRDYFGRLVYEEHRDEIIILDEIDRVFPHRFWQNKAQAEHILDAWQDEHLNLLIISTSHQGKGFDLVLRDAVQLIFVPDFDKRTGITKVTFGWIDHPSAGAFNVDVRSIFPHYRRWSIVK